MKILNKLTIKHLKQNPKRTIVTIIGIILSTSLMVGIGLLFSTARDMMVQLVVQESGRYHAEIEVPKDKLDIVTKNNNVKEYAYISSLGYARYDKIESYYKPYIQVFAASNEYLNDLSLIKGRLPQNENEIVISNHMLRYESTGLSIGDTIKLKVGRRVDSESNPVTGDTLLNGWYNNDGEYQQEIMEKIVDAKTKEYTIVGIVEKDVNESYSAPGYRAFTVGESDTYTVYVVYKNIRKTYENSESIAANLGYQKDGNIYNEVSYNSDLLAINGVSKYHNLTESLGSVVCIVLALVSIACIIVIYNSFAISVMERKKQFGLFASIGTTRKQLRHTVFYEAFIVGLIGIPLGILGAYVGIGTVIYIVNKLLLDMLGIIELKLTTYPLFLIIPVIFMVITIIISAYIPAKLASRVSPIEAIRQNEDIKVKEKKFGRNKFRSPKIIRFLFGIEGDMAYKNMKRNKKKYRVTIVSLFISIVLFISFSALVQYGLEGSVNYAQVPEYEYVLYVGSIDKDSTEVNEFINKVLSVDGIKKITVLQTMELENNDMHFEYSKEAKSLAANSVPEYTNIITLDNNTYNNYLKELGLKQARPIVINRYKYLSYEDESRKVKNIKIFDKLDDYSISFYDHETGEKYDKQYMLKNIYLADKAPMGVDGDYINLTMIVSEDMFNEIYKDENNGSSNTKYAYILADKYDEISQLVKDNNNDKLFVEGNNFKEELQMIKNLILVIKILLYGFIALVTLIGVTSVLNTINTSIALRRKEFAVLRSIGLTPKGFNKVLFFESLFFGLKSLLYGIPVSLAIIYLLHSSVNEVVEFSGFLIPYKSIVIATLGVFIIVMISMRYASRKIKKENILDAIREENI